MSREVEKKKEMESACCVLAASPFDVAESLKVGDSSQLYVEAH